MTTDDEQKARLHLTQMGAETTPGVAADTPPVYRWPEREMVFWYGGHSALVQWQMRSQCPACGGVLEATGDARVGEPFSETTHCATCGAAYTVEGEIVE